MEKSKSSWSDFASRVANFAVVFTVLGVLGQILTYVAAGGFYAYFQLTPDQLGITPVNTLGRLTFTEIVSMFLVAVISWLALVTQRLAYRWRRVELRDLATEGEDVWQIKSPLRTSKLAIIRKKKPRGIVVPRVVWPILAVLLFVSLCLGAHDSGYSAAAEYVGAFSKSTGSFSHVDNIRNPVLVDIEPVVGNMRWTNPNDVPPDYFLRGSSVNDRLVGLLGINDGNYFLYDWYTGVVISLPTSQVQLVFG